MKSAHDLVQTMDMKTESIVGVAIRGALEDSFTHVVRTVREYVEEFQKLYPDVSIVYNSVSDETYFVVKSTNRYLPEPRLLDVWAKFRNNKLTFEITEQFKTDYQHIYSLFNTYTVTIYNKEYSIANIMYG